MAERNPGLLLQLATLLESTLHGLGLQPSGGERGRLKRQVLASIYNIDIDICIYSDSRIAVAPRMHAGLDHKAAAYIAAAKKQNALSKKLFWGEALCGRVKVFYGFCMLFGCLFYCPPEIRPTNCPTTARKTSSNPSPNLPEALPKNRNCKKQVCEDVGGFLKSFYYTMVWSYHFLFFFYPATQSPHAPSPAHLLDNKDDKLAKTVEKS